MPGLTRFRWTASRLLVAAVLAISLTPSVKAHAPRCHPAACEWGCEGWQNPHRYDRCMRACRNECSHHPPPDWEPETQPAEDDQPTAPGFLGLVALVFLALILCALARHRDRRISLHCMRVANALEREAASYRAEAIRRDPDI